MTMWLLALIPVFIAIPILIYNFLIFPNIDGVAQDLSFYNYDANSQHFLYWLGFWTSAILGGTLGNAVRTST